MPSPQSLVTFVATLFVTLILTRGKFDIVPVTSALGSVAVALALGWVVVMRTVGDDDDDVTQDSRAAGSSDQPPQP